MNKSHSPGIKRALKNYEKYYNDAYIKYLTTNTDPIIYTEDEFIEKTVTDRDFEEKHTPKKYLKHLTMNKKPPIGIIPRKFWIEDRMAALIESMKRYSDAGFDIPEEWGIEYDNLHEEHINLKP